MENILHWLETQDYEMGVMLLQAYEPRNRMLPVILKGENDYNKGKLKQELRRIYHSGEHQPQAIEFLKQHKVIAASIETATPEQKPQTLPSKVARETVRTAGRLYPEEIEKAIQVRSKLANERDRLANSLADLSTNEQRAEARAELEAVNKQVQRYHQFVKHYETTKQVLKEKPWQDEEPAEQAHEMEVTEREALRKKLLSARVNRTKKKKAAKKWAADKDADPWMRKSKVDLYQGEFMKWDGIVRQLEEQLGIGK